VLAISELARRALGAEDEDLVGPVVGVTEIRLPAPASPIVLEPALLAADARPTAGGLLSVGHRMDVSSRPIQRTKRDLCLRDFDLIRRPPAVMVARHGYFVRGRSDSIRGRAAFGSGDSGSNPGA
jgi:hypothetical protein